MLWLLLLGAVCALPAVVAAAWVLTFATVGEWDVDLLVVPASAEPSLDTNAARAEVEALLDAVELGLSRDDLADLVPHGAVEVWRERWEHPDGNAVWTRRTPDGHIAALCLSCICADDEEVSRWASFLLAVHAKAPCFVLDPKHDRRMRPDDHAVIQRFLNA